MLSRDENLVVFGHALLDPWLGDTPFQGMSFGLGLKNLRDYLGYLTRDRKNIPENYLKLLEDMTYLSNIEAALRLITDKEALGNLVGGVVTRLMALKAGKLYLPGGWVTKNHGHSMIYEFRVKEKEPWIYFTVYNTGDGVRFHLQQSTLHQDLVNPSKIWRFPKPEKNTELQAFIERLLRAQILKFATINKRPINAELLYTEIFSTISYLDGTELDPNPNIPPFAYIQSQLSGTCSQRCFEAMLKVHSPSLEEYQRFIFGFKKFIFDRFIEPYLQSPSRRLPVVTAKFINLSIQHLLNILTTDALFTPDFMDKTSIELGNIQEQLGRMNLEKPDVVFSSSKHHVFSIEPHEPHSNQTIHTKPSKKYELNKAHRLDVNKPIDDFYQVFDQIKRSSNFLVQYVCLQSLILQLHDLSRMDNFVDHVATKDKAATKDNPWRFYETLEELQALLLNIKKGLFEKDEAPLLKAMLAITLHLKFIAYGIVLKSRHLPPFHISSLIMRPTLKHHMRNPFMGTKNPIFDQRMAEIYDKYHHHYQREFDGVSSTNSHYCDFYRALVECEELKESSERLKAAYGSKWMNDSSLLHEKIRENKLEALFMATQQGSLDETLSQEKFIQVVLTHLGFERGLRHGIAPFFKNTFGCDVFSMSLSSIDELNIDTGLYPFYLSSQVVNDSGPPRQLSKTSPPLLALTADVPNCKMPYLEMFRDDANEIQIMPTRNSARDFFHLRGENDFQVLLTISYYHRHPELLSDRAHQCYLETNFFQRGLLIQAVQDPQFFDAFDALLNTGYRFYDENSRFTIGSLFFVRLDFLVSRYGCLVPDIRGKGRLEAIVATLENQLSLKNSADITYTLQEFLFLTLIALMDNYGVSDELFKKAYHAYFYLNRTTNPYLFEATDQAIEVATASAAFKLFIEEKSNDYLRGIINELLKPDHQLLKNGVTGEFPSFQVKLDICGKKRSYCFYAPEARLSDKKGFAQSGVPLEIRNNPVTQYLGLGEIRECTSSVDGREFRLSGTSNYCIYLLENHELVFTKEWCINNEDPVFYELQSLSEDHPGSSRDSIGSRIPQILRGAKWQYWENTEENQGLLVHDGRPAYLVEKDERGMDQFWVLDSEGKKTGEQLLTDIPQSVTHFENIEFILNHGIKDKSSKRSSNISSRVHLPRHSLVFEMTKGVLTWPETGETIVQSPTPPIHPLVACLVLESKEQQRCMVLVAPFYAMSAIDPFSGFYAVEHDISGVVSFDSIKKEQTGCWDHEGSQRVCFYPLKDGKPIANDIFEALYLAYLYLGTDQTEEAWNILDVCKTRLGGITRGDPRVLECIRWICDVLPYKPSTLANMKMKRRTPPYVACQLKALTLLTEALSQGILFHLVSPPEIKTANDLVQSITVKKQQAFLSKLPNKISQLYTQYLKMGQYLYYWNRLSFSERLSLLEYCDGNLKNPQFIGALGYEWMQLRLESILQEKYFWEALNKPGLPLSDKQQQQFAVIQRQIEAIKPAMAISTSFKEVEVDLDMPDNSHIDQKKLSHEEKRAFLDCQEALFAEVPEEKLNEAISNLSSSMGLIDFFKYFPAYLHIANHKTPQRDLLNKFCQAVLIAEGYLLLEHRSPIAILCRVLYGICNYEHSEGKLAFLAKVGEKIKGLIGLVVQWPVPPLMVYEAEDNFSRVLAKPEEWIAERKRPEPHPLRLPLRDDRLLIEQTGIYTLLSEKNPPAASMIKTLETNFVLAYNTGCDEQKQLATNRIHSRDEMESLAGQSIHKVKETQHALAQAFLSDGDQVEAMMLAAKDANLLLINAAKESWSHALALANKGPSDPNSARLWRIERQAKSRNIFTQKDLCQCYIQADGAFISENTGLGIEEAEVLFTLIHKALVQDILTQTTEKVSRELEVAKKTNDVHSATILLDQLFRPIPGLDNPLIMAAQYNGSFLLRREQVEALELFCQKEANFMAKSPPGSGKSSVIIPLLVAQQANGCHLLVVLVPPALLETNRVDLNRRLGEWFGRRTYCFKFNRYSDVSVQRLRQIYRHMMEVITSGGCLLSTVEIMQSLELKYIELLLSSKSVDKTREEQIFWFDKIISLFRFRAKFIIDEVHQGLSIGKKLNYIFGESIPLDALTIKNAIALFRFIPTDFIKAAPFFDETYHWRTFEEQLANQLINDCKSPLYLFVSNLTRLHGNGIKNDLINYLLNSNADVLNVIQSATEDEKSTLAFLKQQINELLRKTLPQKLNVDYGPSQLPGRDETLAIPYAGNGVANETSLIGNPLVSMNKTIQMMLLQGIAIERLVIKIKEWQAGARQEFLRSSELQDIDSTPTAKGFACLFPHVGFQLSQINTNNQEQILELHERLRFNPKLIFDVLQTHTLPLIHQDNSILNSGSFNVVSQAHRVIGMSGTPADPINYHPCFEDYRPLGHNGYILQVIKDKKPRISVVPFESLSAFIENVLSDLTSGGLTRAIVDISARFAGKSHHEVAKAIALYITANPRQFNASLKHVLYFNNEQVLCAIKINQPDSPPMILGSSDQKELDRLLGSTPEERFTYYDQVHTTGTDIAQYECAHFILMVDDKVSLESFLQGAMRARKLTAKQTIALVVDEQLQGKTFDELLGIFKSNEDKTRKRDVFFAAKGQMHNEIRALLMTMIDKMPSEHAQEKATFVHHMKPFFIETPSFDLFALYGGVNQKQPLLMSLHQYQVELMELLKRCFKEAGINDYQEVIETIKPALEEIINRVKVIDLDGKEESWDKEPATIEVIIEKEMSLETVVSTSKRTLKASELVCWDKRMEGDFLTDIAKYDPIIAMGINHVSDSFKKAGIFSDRVYVSSNYIRTYKEQEQLIDPYLKPVLTIWYHLNVDGCLYATIVTPQEINSLMQFVGSYPTSWVSTTEELLLAGKRPDGILTNPTYQSLREQILFFKGDFLQILDQSSSLGWLQDKQIQFFKEHLAPYRPGSGAHLNFLESVLAGNEIQGFKNMQASPWADHVQCSWTSLFPRLSTKQETEYQKFANALKALNENWHTNDIREDELQQLYGLSMSSVVHLLNHVAHLKNLKLILNRLQTGQPIECLLRDLSDAEVSVLETILEMPRSEFYRSSGYHAIKPPMPSSDQTQQMAWCQATVDAVNRMRTYPAFLKMSEVFERYFETVASQVPFPKVLCLLLDKVEMTPRLLTTILNNPSGDASLRMRVLEKYPTMERSNFYLLVQGAKSEDEFDRILQHANLDQEAIALLLDKPVLQESHLQSLQSAVRSRDVFMKILGHPSATADLAITAIDHWYFSPETLTFIIDKYSLSDQVLLLMLHKPFIDCSILMQLLVKRGDKTTPVFLEAIITHDVFSVEELIKTLSGEVPQLKHILQVFFNLYQSDRSLHIENCLLEFIDKLLNHEAGSQTIKNCIQDHLKEMPDEFTQRIVALRGVDGALERPDSIASGSLPVTTTAHELEYPNGSIAEPPAGFDEQRVSPTSPDSIASGPLPAPTAGHELELLIGSRAEPRARFDERQGSPTPREQQSGASSDVPEKLREVLNRLKIKADSHAKNAIVNKNYTEVAKTATALYSTLDKAVSRHFSQARGPEENKTFVNSCHHAILQAEPVLKKHRGYKQIFLDLLNVLSCFFFLIPPAYSFCKTGQWRFFRADTESIKITKSIDRAINGIQIQHG